MFYRRAELCRSCLIINGHKEHDGVTLEDRAREHVKNKILRQELKKLAKEEHEKRKRVKRNKAVKKLLPLVETESEVQTDHATKELARRELARRRLIEFILQFHPKYLAGWVHRDICRRLEQFMEDVAAERSPRLILTMPPRHGKSQIVSKLYPAWHLGHYPTHEFIGCSYNISLALDFSREIREVLRSEQFHNLFPNTALHKDFQAAESWKLVSPTGVGAGGYNAAGVDGGITGKGAHVLVIDDPIKNYDEAENADIREKAHNWYKSSAYTRLAPGGGVLIIQTRWHDDDLTGRLLKEMEDPEADQFEIVNYPAIAEHDEEFRLKGDALHAERFDIKALNRIKRVLGNRIWSALYQQRPVGEDSAYFKESDFVFRNETPPLDNMYIYQAWDLAISDEQQKQNNSSVGVTVAVDWDDNVHVLEVDRFKTNDHAIIEDKILDMYDRYKVNGWGIENGQIWKAIQKSLERKATKRKSKLVINKENVLQPITDKVTRARPLQSKMQSRRVTFPRGQEWVDVLRKEFLRFPSGAQDDQIDAMAWVTKVLLNYSAPKPPKLSFSIKKEPTVAQKLQKYGRNMMGVSHMSA